jgi:hypothetical protein
MHRYGSIYEGRAGRQPVDIEREFFVRQILGIISAPSAREAAHAYLVQCFTVCILSLVHLFEVFVDFIEAIFKGILQLGKSYRCRVWVCGVLENISRNECWSIAKLQRARSLWLRNTALTLHNLVPRSFKLLKNLVDILNTLCKVGVPPQFRQLYLKVVHNCPASTV